MTAPRRNIELKARDPDPARSVDACKSLGAEDQGVLVQRDTYFNAANGRLKLREQRGDKPHLIAYERSDRPSQRTSYYRIINVEEPEELRLALSEALGVSVVVAKDRRLFLWKSVRIHLDKVEELGSFIEFEAVAPPDSSLSQEKEQVAFLRKTFQIAESDLIAGSYSDLLLQTDRREGVHG
jgi:predicted adenylyl cyclase CyaB